jgi:hypothetical protein
MSTQQALPQGWSTLPPGWSTSAPSQIDGSKGEVLPPAGADPSASIMKNMVESYPPVAAGRELYQGAKRIGGELKQVGQGISEGNPYKAAEHSAYALPFIGAGIKKGVDQLGANEKINLPEAGTALETAAETAPLVLGGLDAVAPGRSLLGQIPSRARAGAVLQDIREQAKDVPVVPNQTMPAINRWTELTDAGGKSAKPLTKLSGRLTDLMTPSTKGVQDQLLFPEARDFYSNVSDVSRQSPLQTLLGKGLKPTMLRQAGNVRSALNADLTSAAGQVGRGADYSEAMKEYAQAMKLRNAIVNAAKVGIPLAVGGGLAGHALKALIPPR